MFNLDNNKLKLIPNILTLFRIFLTPIIIVLLFIDSKIIYQFHFLYLHNSVNITFLISGILFLIATISDFLDGFLARKNNWISDFGKIWDPIADKVLTTSIFISFSLKGLIPIYLVLVMISRDIIVDAFRQNVAKNGIIIPANIYGKLKTIFQMISIIVIYFCFNSVEIYSYKSNNISYYLIQNLLVIVSTIISIVSMIIYINEIKIKNQSNIK